MKTLTPAILIFSLLGLISSLKAQNPNRQIINPNSKLQFNPTTQQSLSQRSVWVNSLQANGSNWSVLWDEITETPYLLSRGNYALP